MCGGVALRRWCHSGLAHGGCAAKARSARLYAPGDEDECPVPLVGPPPAAVPEADAGPPGFELPLELGLELALALGLAVTDGLDGGADVAAADVCGALVVLLGGALLVGAAGVGRLMVPAEPLMVTFTGGGATVWPTLFAMTRPTVTPSAASRSARPANSAVDRRLAAGAAVPRAMGVVG
jgi:hypothetical protein